MMMMMKLQYILQSQCVDHDLVKRVPDYPTRTTREREADRETHVEP